MDEQEQRDLIKHGFEVLNRGVNTIAEEALNLREENKHVRSKLSRVVERLDEVIDSLTPMQVETKAFLMAIRAEASA